jgi:GNAT superfamily N-acetyltransferase
MTNPVIRRAVAADAPKLVDCIDRAYATYAARIDDLPAVSDGVDEDIIANAVWVAERGDSLVGGLILVLKPTYAILANVVVAPSERGTGLGHALILRAEQECRERGVATLKLSTHVKMPENVTLYEHLGWTETARAGNKVHMEKTLTA